MQDYERHFAFRTFCNNLQFKMNISSILKLINKKKKVYLLSTYVTIRLSSGEIEISSFILSEIFDIFL